MFDEIKQITLKGGNYYITEKETDAFRVKNGSVLVYIVPINKNEIGRRSFIYEAETGEVLPSFCYRDMDYRYWRFCFVALEEACIEIIENGCTKTLRERFSKKAKIKSFQVEGYNEGLVDQYRINIVTEDGFIRRTQKDRIETSSGILHLIRDAFQKSKVGVDIDKTGNGLYDCVALLCSEYGIPTASFEKLKEACGDEFGITDIARISHFSYREVILTSGWERRDQGAFLVYDQNKKPCLCLPKGSNSYILYDVENNVSTPVSKKVAQSISAKAFMIYRPLPARKLKGKDLAAFCKGSIRAVDIAWLVILSTATALIGLLTPTISQKLYDEYIPLGAKEILFQLGCLMASFMIANILFSIVKNLVNFRITSKMAYDTQSAIYGRLFNLPESFFRRFESADLAQRVMGAGNVINTVASVIFTSIVSVIFLIVYLIRMISYSGKLTLIGVLMVIVYAAAYYVISLIAIKHKQRSVELTGKTESVMFQFLTGISKIRIAGVEDRALYEYLKPYIRLRNSEEKQQSIVNIGTVLSLVANSVFSIVLYIVIVNATEDISVGTFIAFTSMFGAFTAYLLQVVQGLVSIRSEKPNLERLKPVLEETPEMEDGKELPGDISGAVEINNVTFSYSPDAPNVLENVDLDIRAGEYVGIVGPSGCGKSTLMKLLLGFEKPSSGKIYFDNKDIESVDKRELRKKMGVVLQDGKLISGSIFENITITAPNAALKDVQAVIKAVGLEKDISEMPMGLHTILSEDCGTISGGQQQRILIARAIISNPQILFFDEATSALDNVTQSMVCETLEKMNSTRIVIAHRLSTIIKCDRIIVMNDGRIVEQGNYNELMDNKGLFYELSSRQMV